MSTGINYNPYVLRYEAKLPEPIILVIIKQTHCCQQPDNNSPTPTARSKTGSLIK